MNLCFPLENPFSHIRERRTFQKYTRNSSPHAVGRVQIGAIFGLRLERSRDSPIQGMKTGNFVWVIEGLISTAMNMDFDITSHLELNI